MRSVHVLVPSGGSLAVEVDEAITAQELIENVLPVRTSTSSTVVNVVINILSASLRVRM